MSVDLARAVEGLREGETLLAEGKPRKALAPLCEALDSLDAQDLSAAGDPEAVRLLGTLATALRRACEEAGREDLLEKRGEALFEAGLRRGPEAEKLIRRLALTERRTDVRALSFYIGYLEARGSLDEALRLRLNQILSFALHVRLNSKPEKIRPVVPLLERLHHIRPNLTFPRLYLGRWHYLCGRFREARTYLRDLAGRLGDSPKVLNIRGRSAEKLDLLDEALDLYRRSLAHDRHQPHVHFRAGRILLRQSQSGR